MVSVAPAGEVFYPCLEKATVAGNLLDGPPILLETRSSVKVESNLAKTGTVLFRRAADETDQMLIGLPAEELLDGRIGS